MKFMPQDVFDTCVLVLACNYVSGGEERYEYVKRGILGSYENAYLGDAIYMQEAEDLVEPVIIHASSHFDDDAVEWSLAEAVNILGELDENLEPKRGLRKVFGGTYFTKGHPNPSIRSDQALKDIKRLLSIVKVLEIQRAHGLRT